jgi:hypothetical protein
VVIVHSNQREVVVGARQKLNSATVFGCQLIAGLIGSVTESWFIAAVTAAILIAGAWNDGSIRPQGRERNNTRLR